MKATHYTRLLLTTAAAFSLSVGTASAQEGGPSKPAPETAETKEQDALGFDEIVVTGVAQGGLRKADASFAISTLDSEQIAEFAPLHVGDLLNATPGILAENTGGETGTNTFVRGFAQNGGSGFVTIQLNGLPIYPTSVSGFIENSALFRYDESIERLEALRGGSAVLLSNAQPGVTFNFLQKKGDEEFDGIAKISLTDYGLRRIDLNVSGPINDQTFFSIGGFYRTSPGLRDAQYRADFGGQVEAMLTRRVEGGEINLWARHTDDNNNWYLPIPVQIGTNNKSVSPFPGFNAGYGTYQGNDNRFGILEMGINGETLAVDSKDGRDVKLTIVGASYDQDLGNGFDLSLKAGYTGGSGGLTGPVGGGNPQTLQSFINDTITAANGNAAVVAAAGGPATGISRLVFTGSGQAITDQSIQVMPVGLWFVDLNFSSFVADARISKQFGNNKLTVGAYFSDESYSDEWSLGNNRLMTATANGRRIDLTLNNGVRVTRDSFLGGSFFSRNIAVDTSTWAIFALDEWQITPQLRLEAGGRYEKREYNGSQQGLTYTDLDGNAATLFNNGSAYLNGSFTPVSFKDDQFSWTAAANYEFSDSFSMFARASSGARFPDPDNIVNGQTLTQNIDQYELGLKLQTQPISLFTTLFYNKFSNVPFFELINGNVVLSSSGSRGQGVEVEADVRPFDGFNIQFLGTYTDSKLRGGGNPGKRLFRQPEFVTRITPRYSFGLGGNASAAIYGSVTSYFGERFSDNANQQPLAPYTEVDIGGSLTFDDRFTLRLSVDNLTNSLGLTERNPRASGTGVTSGVTLGRPNFGRSVIGSVEFKF